MNMFYNLYRHNMLDKQGRVFFTDPDDIITTKTDRVFHPVVEKLAFTSVGKFLMVCPPTPCHPQNETRRLMTVSTHQSETH